MGVRELLIKILGDTADFDRAAKSTTNSFSDIADKAGKVGVGMAAVGTGIDLALSGATKKSQEYAKEIVTLQRLTGESAEEASRFTAVFQRYGVEGSKVGVVIKKLSGEIDGQSKALNEAGIATQNADGSNRTSLEVLADLAEYYKNAEDKTKAVTLASKTLGKGYQDLLPILAGGKDALDGITTAAERNGVVFSQQSLDDLKAYGKIQADNSAAMEAFTMKVGMANLPLQTFKVELLGGIIDKLNQMNPKLVEAGVAAAQISAGVGEGVGGLLMFIATAADVAAALAPGGVFAGVGTTIAGWAASAGASIAGVGSAIAGATGIAAAGLVAMAGAVGLGIGSLINKIPAVQRFQKEVGEKLGGLFYDISVKAKKGLDATVKWFQGFPDRVAKALSGLADKVAKAIRGALDWLNRLNPFLRRSPSLVDNVLAGTAIMAKAYSDLGGIRIAAPQLAGMPLPSSSPAGRAYGGGAVVQAGAVQVVIHGNVAQGESTRIANDVGAALKVLAMEMNRT